MKVLLLGILLWQVADAAQAPAPDLHYFQYRRAITLAAGAAGQACATLDGDVYAHGAASLKDLRLYAGAHEVPYAITLSQSAEEDSEPARIMNLGMQDRKIVFDLAMPDRLYTEVDLDLNAKDFLGSAKVSAPGSSGGAPVQLGTFTLFDLSAQHLSRNTTLHLQESRFQTLHIELSMVAAPGEATLVSSPGMVAGAMIPPNREAQTVYTPVATTTVTTEHGSKTLASFKLPARVPVEQIAFTMAPEFLGNFSREVQVDGSAVGSLAASGESLHGMIMRVHMVEAGHDIKQEQLSIPATIGANLQSEAIVGVSIDNGNDAPLPIRAVSLEMRQRRLCFDVPSGAPALTLFYGDGVLQAPVYDFARVLSLASGILPARLGEEEKNPEFMPRPLPQRPLTERHPELLWIVLLAVVCVLAVVAAHSARRMPK